MFESHRVDLDLDCTTSVGPVTVLSQQIPSGWHPCASLVPVMPSADRFETSLTSLKLWKTVGRITAPAKQGYVLVASLKDNLRSTPGLH